MLSVRVRYEDDAQFRGRMASPHMWNTPCIKTTECHVTQGFPMIVLSGVQGDVVTGAAQETVVSKPTRCCLRFAGRSMVSSSGNGLAKMAGFW